MTSHALATWSGCGFLEPMRQHQVWGARQEEGRQALDIRRCRARHPHILEAQARKLGPRRWDPAAPSCPRTESGVYVTRQLSTLSPRCRGL